MWRGLELPAEKLSVPPLTVTSYSVCYVEQTWYSRSVCLSVCLSACSNTVQCVIHLFSHTTPLRDKRRTSMTKEEFGGMTSVTDPVPFEEEFLSVLPSFPNARLGGRVIRRLSPTHMPLAETSHPAGRAPTP